MKYPEFKRRIANEGINEDHFNAIMLLYALSEYEQPNLQEREDFDKSALGTAIRKTQIFLNFDKEKVQDDLIRIRTLNKPAFNMILDFFKKVKPSQARALDKAIRSRMSKNPLSVTFRRDNLIKSFEFIAPPKDKKGDDLSQRTGKARGKKRTSGKYDFGKLPATDYPGLPYRENKEQKLSKLLKPLIEKILREQ